MLGECFWNTWELLLSGAVVDERSYRDVGMGSTAEMNHLEIKTFTFVSRSM